MIITTVFFIYEIREFLNIGLILFAKLLLIWNLAWFFSALMCVLFNIRTSLPENVIIHTGRAHLLILQKIFRFFIYKTPSFLKLTVLFFKKLYSFLLNFLKDSSSLDYKHRKIVATVITLVAIIILI